MLQFRFSVKTFFGSTVIWKDAFIPKALIAVFPLCLYLGEAAHPAHLILLKDSPLNSKMNQKNIPSKIFDNLLRESFYPMLAVWELFVFQNVVNSIRRILCSKFCSTQTSFWSLFLEEALWFVIPQNSILLILHYLNPYRIHKNANFFQIIT